jgi:cytochrome c oxidase subunit 4
MERTGARAIAAHVLPVKVYAGIFAVLLVLTGVTVGVSLLELGSLAIYVAMAVAIVKGSLVIGYFMHLKFDVRFHAFTFLSSILFLVIFFALTMLDLGSRDAVLEAEGNFALRDDRAAAARARPAPARSSKVEAARPPDDRRGRR